MEILKETLKVAHKFIMLREKERMIVDQVQHLKIFCQLCPEEDANSNALCSEEKKIGTVMP